MSDLISREALLQMAHTKFDWNDYIDIEDILNAPTVEAEPVIHGHWILEREPNGKPYCFHCSICDDDFRRISILSAYPYCPACGAKMDEVSE